MSGFVTPAWVFDLASIKAKKDISWEEKIELLEKSKSIPKNVINYYVKLWSKK